MRFAEGTTVPVEKTRAEIEKLAAKYGATRFASGWTEDGRAAISFAAHGRLVRFVLQFPTDEEGRREAKSGSSWRSPTSEQVRRWVEAETRRRWRSLLLIIKAKLEVVASGDATFEEEFLSHVVTDNGMTVYERLRLAEGGPPLLPPIS